MALPDERKFTTFRRGKVRDDIILARFRNSLRDKVNPDTNQIFTEDEIATITQEDSRFYIEADAIDLFGQATQQRAIWFADQVRPDRAASGWLRGVHGALWIPDGLLPASGGSGEVAATGSPGTIYVGSTTIGDPAANIARDPSGKRYQVLVNSVANSAGAAALQMQAIDPGPSTNLSAGTILTWINPPLGADPEASVTTTFTGGFPEETESEFAQRIMRRIRHKPGAGNSPQFRLWAQQASNAVQDAFVFATALHSGSVCVCVVQKRGNATGPFARIPSIGTLTTVSAFLTPPTSPVTPEGVHVLVTPPNAEPTNMALRLSMPKGSSGGWTDVDPWPQYSATFPEGIKITTVTSQTVIEIECDNFLPAASVSGPDAPALMVWNEAESQFETLDVDSVVQLGGNVQQINLNNAPNLTLAVGHILSPGNERKDVLAEAFTDYFDELGPSELVPDTDVRYVRAKRSPSTELEYPATAGQGVIARLDDQLGGALSAAELEYISQNNPTLPTEFEIIAGPNMLTLGNLGIYPF